MSKSSRIISAFFLLLIAGVIIFYQIKLSSVKGNKSVLVVVAQTPILKNEEIKSDMVTVKKIDAGSIVKGSIVNPQEVIGQIATENFRVNEQILSEKVTTKDLWTTKDMRLVSIVNEPDKDNFTAFEVRPLDKVDIYYVPKVNKAPQLENQTGPITEKVDKEQLFLENVEIYDTKSAEGLSYKDKQKDQLFTPKYALLLQPKETVDKIIKKKAEGGYFLFSIHGLRPTIDSSKKNKINSSESSIIFK